MLESELRYRVQIDDRPDGKSTTLRLRDPFLNYAFSDQLKGALLEFVRERVSRGVTHFVIDLTAVNVMDSCGLSVLIGIRRLVETKNGRLVLIVVSPILHRLFAITRLDGVFHIVRDEASAQPGDPAPAASA